jgi:hypothetical protein
VTKKQLQRSLDRFVSYHNEVRPHREVSRQTPASVYRAREKAVPSGAVVTTDGRRLRLDKVDKKGSVTIRYRAEHGRSGGHSSPRPQPCEDRWRATLPGRLTWTWVPTEGVDVACRAPSVLHRASKYPLTGAQ